MILCFAGCDSDAEVAGKAMRPSNNGGSNDNGGNGNAGGSNGDMGLAKPIPGCAPDVLPSTGDPYEDCVARINQLRADCQELPPLKRWKGGEDCADQQAKYDFNNGVHAGAKDKICDWGNGQNECIDSSSEEGVLSSCLQRMWDEGPGEDFQAHGHYLNMASTRFTEVACGYYKTPEGFYWAVQNFR